MRESRLHDVNPEKFARLRKDRPNLSAAARSCKGMSHSPKISGEDPVAVLRFLPYVEMGEERTGLVKMVACNVPSDVGVALVRAAMRREARLLLEDADSMEGDDWEPRTPEQRRADAFGDVLLSALALLRYSR